MSGVKGRSGGRLVNAGRRAFIPTITQREQVAYLAQLGLCSEDIRPLIKNQDDKPIHPDAFARHFQAELERGKPNHSIGSLLPFTVKQQKAIPLA